MGLQEFGIKRLKIRIDELKEKLDVEVQRCTPKVDFTVSTETYMECKAGEEVDFVYGDRHAVGDTLKQLSEQGLLQYAYSETINEAIHGEPFPDSEKVASVWGNWEEREEK